MRTYTAQELSSSKNSAILKQIVAMLSRAFASDAATKFLFPNHSQEEYEQILPDYMRTLVRIALLSDALTTVITQDELQAQSQTPSSGTSFNNAAATDIRAISIVIPPHGNARFNSTLTIIRAGVLALPFKFGLGFTQRFVLEFLPGMERMNREVFPDPATKDNVWHLLFLAVDPKNHGQGLGKRLLLQAQEHVKQSNRIEAEAARATNRKFDPLPMYLEASNGNNKRLYSRVGFLHRGTLVYGAADPEKENPKLAEDGTVLGGKVFGMMWPAQ